MWASAATVFVLSVFHGCLGVISICVGLFASIRAEVWLAHSVSPIWSGAFFAVTAILGFASTRRKTPYMIMCFTAFCVVSMVTAIVSIQLLRLGLVNHTTDGHTFQKEDLDMCILVALGTTGLEIVVCLVSPIPSWRLAKLAKIELQAKREGPFHIEVLGQKDIVVVSRQSTPNCKKKSNAGYRLKREHIHATIL
ncbi:hypothetical protein CAPTEDRAFT_225997 [Capitella teleta]|uniref:Transmembrane protein 196 n=1 Tax=Capitella teleta TaxID=283909 RepID=R7UCT9_CAPTE|nr:hypothetical protein CAPTEDRAFT_225997 [Capitella teleta]|eukprot:ELU04200.1 hypothetical protein CAPTEDRAFT_225997 [Capitella teleta]